ncbi:hypothetical protein GGI15_000442 [Coemansia interrupta]|uniref:Uncharacterized protein n=1 Tax=Coemansia interrupta TaxID=1126814 RepID=A0A9W8HKA3_9FUNG|nr:hypothetical protein GGI15_000442 [Coemansia interrupta]
MRSLVSRLWSTSLKSANSATGMDAAFADAAALAANSSKNSSQTQQQQQQSHSVSASAQTLSASYREADDSLPNMAHRAATVTERTRAPLLQRRPTAESVFSPSPFAYNKRLAGATPSVASLRDVDRARTQSPALSRRHSMGRAEAPRARQLDAASPVLSEFSSGSDFSESARCVSPANARRLLSTLNAVNSPLLDARTRSVDDYSTMPLRRLPVSLLALSDVPSRTHRSPLANTFDMVDKDTLRRSASLKSIPRSHKTAPSLARTIQLQQARKAVADRLLWNRTANKGEYSTKAVAGDVHMRDDDDDDDQENDRYVSAKMRNKRRRADDGHAVTVTGDDEMADSYYGDDNSDSDARYSRTRLGRSNVRRDGRRKMARKTASRGSNRMAVDRGIKWKYSARLEAVSDNDEESSSSDSDIEREAVAAKVPLAKIRGGELIGLSMRPSTSTSAPGITSAVVATAVRSTGFGSTRTPVPIVPEPEKPADAAPKTPPKQTSAPLISFNTPAAVVTPAPLSSQLAKDVERQASPSPAPGAASSLPSLFGNLAPAAAPATKPKEAEAVGKPTTTTSGDSGAGAQKPLFGFGKPAASLDTSAEKAPGTDSSASAAPLFSFGGLTSSSAAPDSASNADKAEPSAKRANLISFGKPTDSDGTNKTTSLFGATKESTSETSKPAESTSASTNAAPTSGLFSFGKQTETAPSASLFGFSKPSEPVSSAAATSATASESTAAPAPASSGLFASKFSFGKTSDTPSLFGVKGDADKPAEDSSKSAATETAKPATSGFSFTFGKQADASTEVNKSAPTQFSFGQASTAASDTAAADSNTTASTSTSVPVPAPAPALPSMFGAQPSTISAETSTANTGAAESSSMFGSTIVKRGRSNSGTDSGMAGNTESSFKPSFTFGSSAGSGLGPLKPTASEGGTSSESKPSTGLSFGNAAPVTSAADTSASGGSTSFGFGAMNSFASAAPPAKTIDATATSSTGAAKPPAFTFGSAGNSATATPTMGNKSLQFGSFGKAATPSGGEPATKKPMFSFGESLNTPSAASFETASVPTPAAPSFASSSLAAPSFGGAPAATPSSLSFGAAAASSPAATTPATPAFSFNAKPSLTGGNNTATSFGAASTNASFGAANAATPQTSFTFGGGGNNTASGFGQTANSSSGFGQSANNSSSGFGQAANTSSGFGQMANSSSGFGQTNSSSSGFGQQPSGFSSGFGQQPNGASTSAFGQQSGASGFGQQPNTASTSAFGQQSNVSTAGFGQQPNTASTSGFGQQPNTASTSGFGQQSNASTGFGQQPNTASTTGFTFNSGGFGVNASNSGFGGGSNVSTFGGATSTAPNTGHASQFSFGQGSNVSTTGGAPFTFNANSSNGFNSGSRVVSGSGGVANTAFNFSSNASQQGTPMGGAFQFTSGSVAQQSNPGGMSMGRVAGGSNASMNNPNRKIAVPRRRAGHR